MEPAPTTGGGQGPVTPPTAVRRTSRTTAGSKQFSLHFSLFPWDPHAGPVVELPIVIHFYNKIIFKYVYSLFSKINIIITIKCTIYRGGRLGLLRWRIKIIFPNVNAVPVTS